MNWPQLNPWTDLMVSSALHTTTSSSSSSVPGTALLIAAYDQQFPSARTVICIIETSIHNLLSRSGRIIRSEIHNELLDDHHFHITIHCIRYYYYGSMCSLAFSIFDSSLQFNLDNKHLLWLLLFSPHLLVSNTWELLALCYLYVSITLKEDCYLNKMSFRIALVTVQQCSLCQ